jgi:hypothetical protein
MVNSFETLLTTEQKIKVVEDRISQFATEAYQHSLNKTTSDTLEATEQAEISTKNIEILEIAIKVHQEELAKLQASI